MLYYIAYVIQIAESILRFQEECVCWHQIEWKQKQKPYDPFQMHHP